MDGLPGNMYICERITPLLMCEPLEKCVDFEMSPKVKILLLSQREKSICQDRKFVGREKFTSVLTRNYFFTKPKGRESNRERDIPYTVILPLKLVTVLLRVSTAVFRVQCEAKVRVSLPRSVRCKNCTKTPEWKTKTF